MEPREHALELIEAANLVTITNNRPLENILDVHELVISKVDLGKPNKCVVLHITVQSWNRYTGVYSKMNNKNVTDSHGNVLSCEQVHQEGSRIKYKIKIQFNESKENTDKGSHRKISSNSKRR